MAKKVKQFRYYADNTSLNSNNKNYPETLKFRQLISGSVFSAYMPIVQLGIQSVPGTKFYLNGSNNPIIIGNTGIYELDLQGLSQINSLQFDANSVTFINDNDTAYLIVDIIYEEVG